MYSDIADIAREAGQSSIPTVGIQAAPSRRAMRARRTLVLTLNVATVVTLTATMWLLLSSSGWTIPEIGMLVTFAATLPWLSLGFWNATIGFFIARLSKDTARFVNPAWRDAHSDTPVITRTALALAIRNEDPRAAIARLEAMQRELDATGYGHLFGFHVLSDSSRPDVWEQEEREVREWQLRAEEAHRIHYRRRSDNVGFKAGNVREFCLRYGDSYDLFIPLDADSAMSAAAILRLVRCMQVHPEIGILQGLVVGAPATSLFARVFQFGMRHGMRSYTAGSAWWQGDCGPFWGHNAAIRIKAFRDHCALPVLAGKGPLGGHVLSHDQVEAVLMRRAGYEVRVVAEEDESYEENPPSLSDFIKRELRWCQGNLQYLNPTLLGMPGLPAVSRIQLLLAILMYLGAPFWMLFIAFGSWQAFMPMGTEPYSSGLGISLFLSVIAMSLMPKLMGLLDTLLSPARRRGYGGGLKLLGGAAVEIVFSALTAPVVGFAIARFAAGLAFGRRIAWVAQQRADHSLGLREALRSYWPQGLCGVLLVGILTIQAPVVLPWAAPLFTAFLLAVPFAIMTAAPWAGRFATGMGLCSIPEEQPADEGDRREDLRGLVANEA